ncbi:MAG: hypothetical protein ACFBSE_16715 [Prochloraceae cyanobacterium]
MSQNCTSITEIPILEQDLSKEFFSIIKQSEYEQLYLDFLAAQIVKNYLDCSDITTEIIHSKDLSRPAIVLVLPNLKCILCQQKDRWVNFNFELFKSVYGIVLVDFKKELETAEILPFIPCQPVQTSDYTDPILSKLFST